MLALIEDDQNGKISAPKNFPVDAETGTIAAPDIAEAAARVGIAEADARARLKAQFARWTWKTSNDGKIIALNRQPTLDGPPPPADPWETFRDCPAFLEFLRSLPKPAKQFSDCEAIQSYLKRLGAEWRGLDTAVVRDEDRDGYELDVVTIRFAADGSIKLTPQDHPADCEPTAMEAALIRGEAATVQLPQPVPIPGQLAHNDIPWPVRKAWEEGRLFVFYDTEGTRVMARERVEKDDGSKFFIPWTYWADGVWQQREPGGPLPFWGMEFFVAA